MSDPLLTSTNLTAGDSAKLTGCIFLSDVPLKSDEVFWKREYAGKVEYIPALFDSLKDNLLKTTHKLKDTQNKTGLRRNVFTG